MFKKIRMK